MIFLEAYTVSGLSTDATLSMTKTCNTYDLAEELFELMKNSNIYYDVRIVNNYTNKIEKHICNELSASH